jgi:hypothetical protein
MSRDPEQEYFSDGISEDIITDLSKVSFGCSSALPQSWASSQLKMGLPVTSG